MTQKEIKSAFINLSMAIEEIKELSLTLYALKHLDNIDTTKEIDTIESVKNSLINMEIDLTSGR